EVSNISLAGEVSINRWSHLRARASCGRGTFGHRGPQAWPKGALRERGGEVPHPPVCRGVDEDRDKRSVAFQVLNSEPRVARMARRTGCPCWALGSMVRLLSKYAGYSKHAML